MSRKKIGNITVYLNAFRKDEKEPRYRGKIDIEGETFECGLWVNDDEGGVPINLSGTINRPRDES